MVALAGEGGSPGIASAIIGALETSKGRRIVIPSGYTFSGNLKHPIGPPVHPAPLSTRRAPVRKAKPKPKPKPKPRPHTITNHAPAATHSAPPRPAAHPAVHVSPTGTAPAAAKPTGSLFDFGKLSTSTEVIIIGVALFTLSVLILKGRRRR